MSPEIPDIVLVKPLIAEDKFERFDDKLSISLDTKLDIADIVSAHEHSHDMPDTMAEIPEIAPERLVISLETKLDMLDMRVSQEHSQDIPEIEADNPDIVDDKMLISLDTKLDMLDILLSHEQLQDTPEIAADKERMSESTPERTTDRLEIEVDKTDIMLEQLQLDKLDIAEDNAVISLEIRLDIADIVSAHEHSHEIPDTTLDMLSMSFDRPDTIVDRLSTLLDITEIELEQEQPGKLDMMLDKPSMSEEMMLDTLDTIVDSTESASAQEHSQEIPDIAADRLDIVDDKVLISTDINPDMLDILVSHEQSHDMLESTLDKLDTIPDRPDIADEQSDDTPEITVERLDMTVESSLTSDDIKLDMLDILLSQEHCPDKPDMIVDKLWMSVEIKLDTLDMLLRTVLSTVLTAEEMSVTLDTTVDRSDDTVWISDEITDKMVFVLLERTDI